MGPHFPDVGLALGADQLDVTLDGLAIGTLAVHVHGNLLVGHRAQRLGQIVDFDRAPLEALLDRGIHQVPRGVGVERAALGHDAAAARLHAEPRGVRVLGDLVGQTVLAPRTVGNVRRVEPGIQLEQLVVVRRRNLDRRDRGIDGGERALPFPCELGPPLDDRLLTVSREHRVDDDVAITGCAGFEAKIEVVNALVRGFVPGDEDDSQRVPVERPVHALQRHVERTADVLFTALGGKRHERSVDRVEVVGEVGVLGDPSRLLSGLLAAEREQSDPQLRRRLHTRQLADHVPQPRAGRVEEILHAARGVETDDDVHGARILTEDLRRAARRASRGNSQDHQDRKNGQEGRFARVRQDHLASPPCCLSSKLIHHSAVGPQGTLSQACNSSPCRLVFGFRGQPGSAWVAGDRVPPHSPRAWTPWSVGFSRRRRASSPGSVRIEIE